MADNRRLCVATPGYLKAHGTPQHPSELSKFDCLTLSSEASQTRGWAFSVPRSDPARSKADTEPPATTEADPGGEREIIYLRPGGPLDCSDGQVLHDWCLAGHGIAWRSTWEVEAEVAAGRLVTLLEAFDAPPNGIYMVFPQRKHLPLRVRLWIDFLKDQYSQPALWRSEPSN